jgi:predicted RNA-binding protein Jag
MPAPSATAEDEEGEPADQDDATAEDTLSLSEQQQQAAELGTEIVKGILEKMGLEGEVNTRVAGGTVYVEVFGDEMGILIGRGGATLEALQELVRAGVQRRLKTRQALVVDVEAYWERRRTTRRRDDGEERRRGPRGERRGGRGGDGRRERDGNR